MSIIEAAERYKEICVHSYSVICPVCSQKQYSQYDKLFVVAYDECVNCNDDTSEEYLRKGTNILRIIENEPEKKAG